ncbi:PREDICTED: ADNP homeobox protein 2 [Elephantulus edwardii]|uniref:ADNP homeobox protein 2 n=1 Tax=Elephantulus edwardii TaxID=28737 RepID=UPI0003F086D9|nr:PREDICTED: ADNP homeobox protein 2 [Elephantulus edwardii]
MFQIPVANLDNIRKVRKKVKGILLDIGLDNCRELLKDLKPFDPGEKYFHNTSWGDVALWEPSAKKMRYRTKPYCCGLCKYSTKVLTSFRNHLHRYHEDEIDQELVVPCPSCVFVSQPKVVGKHMRVFHPPARRAPIGGDGKPSRSEVLSFTCLKCNFSDTLYYSMKKHVLVAHFHHLINAYFGLWSEDGAPQSKGGDPPPEKMPAPDRYFCKKCSAYASSQDALMYHILTSEMHRDLENKLRSVISEHMKKTGLLKQMNIAPKPAAHLTLSPNPSTPGLPATPPCFHLSLPHSSHSQTLVQPMSVATGTSGGLTPTAPPSAAQSQVTLVSSPLPVGHNGLALQSPVPQPVFMSQGVPLSQPLNPAVLPLSQPVGPAASPADTGILPMNPTIGPGILPLSQPAGPLNRPARSGVLPGSRPPGPGAPAVGHSAPGVLQAVSPGMLPVGHTGPTALLPAHTASPGVLPAGQMVQSGVLPMGQTAPPGMLHARLTVPARALPSGQTVPLRVLPAGHKATSGVLPAGQVIPSGLLPPSQAVPSGVLPVGQSVNSGVLQLGQPVVSGVLPVGQQVRPGVLQLGQSVSTSLLPVSQTVRPSAAPSTTFLTSGSILRQLIPTGKQVNGIPTYTLAPVSVTLPVPPGGVPATTPPQMPLQLLQPGTAGLPPPPIVVTTPQSVFVQASSSVSESSQALRQAKQWKTCPVCNELFPSNVYQVHMEVAHRHGEATPSERLEPEKLAACAPFLKWMKEKTVRCLSCKRLVPEEELIRHLLTHGLGCLFCPCTFHNLRALSEHGRTKHLGKKRLPMDYGSRGFQLAVDTSGSLMFPHIDFVTLLPKDELGEREVYLAVLAGIHSKALVPVYIKVRPLSESTANSPSQPVLTCPFCFVASVTPEAYEGHLKERHHIMPTVHTVLKSPAFKCIHCCGVYTGNMTLAAIAVHLLRCRSAPKDRGGSDLHLQPGFIDNSGLLLVNGDVLHEPSFTMKRKLPDGHAGFDEPRTPEQQPLVVDASLVSAVDKASNILPFKRQRNEGRTDGLLISEEALQILALNPREYEDRSYEEKKQFLRDYFHQRPYPSKKEIELLSSLLWVWKIDVASFFGKRRYICMKAIKSHKSSVLLGFDMSELKNVKHKLNFECGPHNL